MSDESDTFPLITDSLVTYTSDSSNTSLTNCCRICYDKVEEIKNYCNCDGSTAPIHFECLKKWITVNNYKTTCEICNGPYKIIIKKTNCSKNNIVLLCFIFILNLFFWLTLWMLLPIVIKDKDGENIFSDEHYIMFFIIFTLFVLYQSYKFYDKYSSLSNEILENF